MTALHAKTKLAILMYHSIDDSGSVVSVSPHLFRQQMKCLFAMGWQAQRLCDAVEYRRANGQYPDRTVVITFDDGFANLYEHALPTLTELDFVATVFVVTDHIGENNNWASPPPGLGVQRLLSWSQLKELRKAGWEIGAHSRTHPDLRQCDQVALESEIIGSAKDVEDYFGEPVRSFAYPYGYHSLTASEITVCTFQAACTTLLRRTCNEPAHLLPRVDAYYVRTLDDMRSLVTGKWDYYLTWRRWARHVRAGLSSS